MNVIATPTFTPDDLLKMPDGDGFELVNGRLVERNMGARSSWVGGMILRLLAAFCDATAWGWVFPADASYQCFPDAPNMVRKPDASLVRFGRFPDEVLPEGHIRIAPDMVIEVVSPNDLFYEVEEKAFAFLRAGVRVVWVVNPDSQTVHVYTSGAIVGFRETDEITGGDVLPGFRCPVREFFTPPQPPPPPASNN
jgi:Uma2 family endonuclease